MPLPLVLLLAASATPALAEAGQGAPPAQPVLVAEADGSWTITQPIHEDPWAVELATDGLVSDDEAVEDRESIRAAELDEKVEDAFEDAVDGARAEERFGPQP